MLAEALGALEGFGLASGLARSAPLYAAVSAAHLLGIALLLGPILLVDLHLAGLLRRLDAAGILALRRTAALGLALAAATGPLLFSARPFDYADNPAMRLKLLVVALGAAHALALEWRWRRNPALLRPGRPAAWLAGFASLAAWLAALALGRWIAFV